MQKHEKLPFYKKNPEKLSGHNGIKYLILSYI
jgi:hypothetical protein